MPVKTVLTVDKIKEKISEIKDMIMFAHASVKVLEYLYIRKPLALDDVIMENEFLRFNITVNWRVTVLELTKLFPDTNTNDDYYNHYAFRRFVREIQETGLFDDEKLKVIEQYIQGFEKENPETKKIVTHTLKLWRDKVIAHSDIDRKDYAKDMGLSLQILLELIRNAEWLHKEINLILFETKLVYRIYSEQPYNELEKIVEMLAEKKIREMKVNK